MRLSIMKIMVLIWSTSVEKEIVALSFLSFSLIIFFIFRWASLASLFYLGFFGLFYYYYYYYFVWNLIPTYGGIIVSIILSPLGQCSNNDDHHTSIYLQLMDYNSILEQDMTLYECLRRCTGICNESRVTCMEELWRWLCHKYDVNYMIMQRAIWQK